MNTKKNKNKNKLRPVPINPILCQTDEDNVATSDEIVQEDLETVIKSDERVPEIISEGVHPSAKEEDSECDAPKKPKRNRGKKKKTDKTNNEEVEEKKSVVDIIDKPVVESDIKDHKNKVIKEETEISNVSPTERKKKNKNKKHSESEDIKSTETAEVSSKDPENKETGSTQEILIKESLQIEIKTPKKKNKKKKRNDSEKSDKNEEEISCTAAFQKILEPRDESKDCKSDNKINEPYKPVEITRSEGVVKEVQQMSTKKYIDQKIVEPIKKEGKNKKEKVEKQQVKDDCEEDFKINLLLQDVVHSQTKLEETKQESVKEDGKSKKEKEKKQLVKKVFGDLKTNVEDEDVVKTQENLKETKQSDIQTFEASVEKDCAKPKAKIAKPVEKKQKQKIAETVDVTKVTQFSVPETQEKVETSGSSNVFKEIPVVTKTDEQWNTQPTPEKSTSEAEIDTTTIHVPKSGMGKKRRKSPKSPQTSTDEQLNIDEEIKSDKLEIAVQSPSEKGTVKYTSEIKDALKTEEEKPEISLLPISFTEPLTSQPETELSSIKFEEQICPVDEFSADKSELAQLKDIKKSKNKNSPKMPKNIDPVDNTEVKSFESTKKDESKKEKSMEITDFPTLTPLSEDFEIMSVKAEESEGSICDVVPDVQYPRASSLDNNNNILIQDITTKFTEQLNVPVSIPDTPLITGSGETPISTPDVMTPVITTTGIKTETEQSSEEKTDLKSKVMEVNKDMEVLRQSIERSLAELTAIEKREQQVEQRFEDSRNKMETKDTEKNKEDVTPVCTKMTEEARVKESEVLISLLEEKKQCEEITSTAKSTDVSTPPVCPARKDNKGKGKSKKKGKQEILQQSTGSASSTTTENSSVTGSAHVSSENKDTSKENDGKTDKKTEQAKGKQQCELVLQNNSKDEKSDFEPIENFEDAMTSSADDVNKNFQIIAEENDHKAETGNEEIELTAEKNPEINITAPTEDNDKPDKDEKVNPVSQPKNLLGHPNIPVRLNKADYKKEKHKTPNARQARVNIKDSVPIDKESKESQTEFKRKYLKDKSIVNDTMTCTTSENEEFVYKYSFRNVFLPSACYMCKKELNQARVPCSYCNLVFYCSQNHKDEDYAQHQGFCFAVSTIVHLKNQKHIYADARNITGHDYRLLRMQMIVSCEKILKRKLTPCEQEILLYPRICADTSCREWRQAQLEDCEGCGQISFCAGRPEHFPKSHQRWCKSYALYRRLVTHQQTRGRLQPHLPARVLPGFRLPAKINEVLASMYEEKIDMNDMQYAALTQIATAPLTAAYCHQLFTNQMNATYANGAQKKSVYTIHVVGAELQFEADALNKWEVFFLHLRPDVTELRVALIGHDLNPSNLPLDLLSKIRLCEDCRQNKRRVIFDFQDGKTYQEYWSTDFITPDLVCAFNPSIQRSSIYNGKDHWASTIKCILKLKVPFVVTAYTLIELHRDLARIKEVSDINVNVISEPNYNSFASVRPDRNFISDDEMPLLFKNYCFMLISGAL